MAPELPCYIHGALVTICKIRFVEQLPGVIILKQTRENKTNDSRTCIQGLLNSGKPHPGLPEPRCRSII